jgi:hypothetical protein
MAVIGRSVGSYGEMTMNTHKFLDKNDPTTWRGKTSWDAVDAATLLAVEGVTIYRETGEGPVCPWCAQATLDYDVAESGYTITCPTCAYRSTVRGI